MVSSAAFPLLHVESCGEACSHQLCLNAIAPRKRLTLPKICPGVRGVKTAGSGRKPQDLSGVLLGEYGLETC